MIGFTGGEAWNQKFASIPVALAFAVVGALVAARTGNRLGWLFLGAAVATAVILVAYAYAARAATAQLPGAAWAGWIFTVVLGIVDAVLPGSAAVPGRTAALAALVAGGMGRDHRRARSDGDRGGVRRELHQQLPQAAGSGDGRRAAREAYNQAEAVGLLVLLAGVISMIVRFRRSGEEERLQLKWFMYASAVAAVVILVATQLSNDPLLEWEIVFPLIPVAVGIAILKYRLYDIDRLISRTLGYAIVTGLLVGLYAGLVLLATQVLSIKSPVAVAASTLAAAALFTPLRRRVQHVVDRRFNRVRYDADQTVAAFAARLQEGAALDAVRSDLLAVVNTAVEPAHLSVWTAPAARRP